eukprot:CAMPEP_0119065892 /NCGR_PEP_ID=MMETSP1178-20130426/8598_1 /TAXON_ID=33656 /ORGANISM="unid sp, Strain CCMP2000" /LENGTH=273 /DNA_ID=CAMNT_0007047451 /DNA_START=81 /DNA_END=899 /DNA_ORIENTATION=+
MFSATPISSDGGACWLELPPWHLTPPLASQLIDEAFGLPRRSSDLPLAERMVLNAQHDALSAQEEPPCAPSTYGTLPADIFSDPAFWDPALAADAHVLDIGAGDGHLIATAVLVHGASSAYGIEMSGARVADGCAALERLAAALGGLRAQSAPHWPLSAAATEHVREAPPRKIELRVGDARTEPFGRATSHVMIYATCFPRGLAQLLQRRLAAELPVGARVLAAGADGWDARLAAEHSEQGARWLVNREANRSAAAVDGEERPCLGDVGRMVW